MNQPDEPLQAEPLSGRLNQAVTTAARIREEVRKAFLGQDDVIDLVLTALLAGGHVLIEGVPGLGKTLLVRALAKTFGGDHGRVQFTPDLMPSDVIGHVMFDQQQGSFKIRRGPVFTNLLLADEINRAPAKTQAALLEAMQERQVTLEGRSLALPKPFMTLATQNPVEQEGTYPLPEAQLDRFLLKIQINYPEEADEFDLVEKVISGGTGEAFDLSNVEKVAEIADIPGLQAAVTALQVDRRITEYAVRIVRASREWPGVAMGAGPRGSIALLRSARAYALLNGRDFVVPDDIKHIAPAVLRHRMLLTPDMEIEGKTTNHVVKELLTRIEAPRL
ncbi:MAG: MoxR family ATPase [Acidobacteriota bacterium]|nr:MoxR family ATPase [Acidobacteriota bacterium]